MTEFEQRLLYTLDHIHNDLETLALAVLTIPPPLILRTAANPEQMTKLIGEVEGMARAHRSRGQEINRSIRHHDDALRDVDG